MENPNSFALLFQDNYKLNNKNPRGRVFDLRLGGENSRLNRLKKRKKSYNIRSLEEGQTQKKKLKKDDNDNDSDDSRNDRKIPQFEINADGTIDTQPQAPYQIFLT